MFMVTENKSGDSDVGNGNGNVLTRNPENNLSGNGNGNFQKKKNIHKLGNEN